MYVQKDAFFVPFEYIMHYSNGAAYMYKHLYSDSHTNIIA